MSLSDILTSTVGANYVPWANFSVNSILADGGAGSSVGYLNTTTSIAVNDGTVTYDLSFADMAGGILHVGNNPSGNNALTVSFPTAASIIAGLASSQGQVFNNTSFTFQYYYHLGYTGNVTFSGATGISFPTITGNPFINSSRIITVRVTGPAAVSIYV
jgi:hypothetical protein